MNDAIITRIIIFAKIPQLNETKTRLIPALGPEGAHHLEQKMFEHAITQGLQVLECRQNHILEVCIAGEPNQACEKMLNHKSIIVTQQQGDLLGERILHSVEQAIGNDEQVIFIGTDCPEIDCHWLTSASDLLNGTDIVVGPSVKGSYALLGLKKAQAQLFTNIPWSTDKVYDTTVAQIRKLTLNFKTLPQFNVIEEPTDLKNLPKSWQSQFQI